MDERYASVTVAVAEGATQDGLITAYRGAPDSSGTMTFSDAAATWEDGDPFYVQTFAAGSCVVAVENNGVAGNDLGIAKAAVGDTGQFVSFRWSVTGGHHLLSLVGGQVDGDCDVLAYVHGGEPNGPVPEWVSRVDWTKDPARAAYLALISDVMRVQVTPEWFTGPHTTTPIPWTA
ncbi:hypothetical protein [Actinokineospora iranica]|nr:hypothetical protein [Actinokineospora iranica]